MKKFEHTDVNSLHEFTVDCLEKVNSVYLWANGVREFNEDDNDRRIEFCETFLSLLSADPDLINHLIWSDKVPFSYSQLRDLLCGSEFGLKEWLVLFSSRNSSLVRVIWQCLTITYIHFFVVFQRDISFFLCTRISWVAWSMRIRKRNHLQNWTV